MADDFTSGMRRVVDNILSIPGRIKGRRYTVSILQRTWTGERPGLGTPTDTLTPLTVEDGYAPLLAQVSQRDIIASGGVYQNLDLKLKLPKDYNFNAAIGGYSRTDLDPSTDSNVRQFWYVVTNFVEPLAYYDKVEENLSSDFITTLILRKTAKVPQ